MRWVGVVFLGLLCVSVAAAQPHVAISDLFVSPVAGQPFSFAVSAYSDEAAEVDFVLEFPEEGFRVRDASGDPVVGPDAVSWHSQRLAAQERFSASVRLVPRDVGEYSLTVRSANDSYTLPVSVREPGLVAPAPVGEDQARLSVGLLGSGAEDSFSVDKDELALSELSFVTASQVNGGTVFVADRARAPVPFAREAFAFMEISAPGVSADSLRLVVDVDKRWVDSRGVAADMRVFALEGSSWRELPTRLLSSAGAYRFSAVADDFSYVAVAMRDPPAPAQEPVEQEESAPSSNQEESSGSDRSSAVDFSRLSALIPSTGVLLGAGVVFLLFALVISYRRYRAEHPDKSKAGIKKLNAKERFEEELDRAHRAIEEGDSEVATEAYLFAHDAYKRASSEPVKWREKAYDRLNELFEKLDKID